MAEQERLIDRWLSPEAVSKVGWPVFTSIALGFILYKFGMPMIERQNAFIDSVARSVEMQSTALQGIQSAFDKQLKANEELNEKMQRENAETRNVVQNGHGDFVMAIKQMKQLSDKIGELLDVKNQENK